MKKYFALTLTLVSLIFPGFGMENDNTTAPGPKPSLSQQLSNLVCQRVSKFYYTTSVVGYDSQEEPTSKFLQNKFKEGWVREELTDERDLPLPGQDGFKEIEFLLGFIPGQSIVSCPHQKSVYYYLYKEDHNFVNIFLLHKVSRISFQTDQPNTNQPNTNQPNTNQPNTNQPNTNQPKIHEFHQCWFDLSKSESYNLSSNKWFIEICKKFNNKPIKVRTLLRSEESTSSNLGIRLISIFSGGSLSVIGHLCYLEMDINSDRQSMGVKVIDPLFDTEKPYVKSVFGSSDPLPHQSRRLFKRVAEDFRIDQFQHTYHYRGDQIINFHDCGRFSIIYLLYEMKGSNALNLSNYDIYQGFKILEADGFHASHETITEVNQFPRAQTWFSWGVGGTYRAICKFILNNLH